MKNNQSIIFLFLFALLSGSAFFLSYSELLAASDTTVNVTAKISVCGNGVKEGSEHCDSNNDLGGKTCANLGFDGGTLACSSSCEFNTVDCTTNATVTSAPTFTATTGGEYTLADSENSATVTVPENFYTQDLKLEMFSYEESVFESSKPAPSGKSFVGNTYDFVFVNPDGNTVSEVLQPVTLVLAYTDADVSGLDESTLAPYRWGSDDTSWQSISTFTIDAVNNEVTFSTGNFSSFALFGAPPATPTPIPVPTTPSGGGGGGGGGYVVSTASVVFSGRAYPKSTVTLLKDAQIAATTVADANAAFSLKLPGLSAGNYTFGIYSKDDKGVRSSLLSFPLNITSGTTAQMSSVFIAPTIAVDKSEVRRGDSIVISGQSVPNGEITIVVVSAQDLFIKTVADQNGSYLYNFSTLPLEIGQHFVKSQAILNGEVSSFSKTIGFAVGTKNVFTQSMAAFLGGDFNNDGRVNLVDFSIAAYWHGKPSPPALVDLNNDGKINLIDFSILAFYWTG